MITKLSILRNKDFDNLPVYNRVEFDERLDEQLDSGSVQTISNSNVPFEGYSLYKIVTTDVDKAEREEYMFGFDTVEKRGKGYYIHTIELVEPTRIVMGIPIDGCKVTQPIEGAKKSLYTATDYLLKYKVALRSTGESTFRFQLIGSDTLNNTISTEFHWECGTLLWECLCDIGNVINCIPRINRFSYEKDGTVSFHVEFVPVNDITAEYEL